MHTDITWYLYIYSHSDAIDPNDLHDLYTVSLAKAAATARSRFSKAFANAYARVFVNAIADASARPHRIVADPCHGERHDERHDERQNEKYIVYVYIDEPTRVRDLHV